MNFTKLFNKWHYLLYALSSIVLLQEVQGKPLLNYNIDTNVDVGKIVRRYTIDVNKHWVKKIDYLELQNSEEVDDGKNVAQKVRNYIRILEYKEKNDRFNKKLRANLDKFDIATEITEDTKYINLSRKKNVNFINFQIFCIESTQEKCQNIQTNLNRIGESLSKQLVIKEPINILVKTVSFCTKMGKYCGAVKTNAITNPSSFYSLYSNDNESPYLYPQALVKQLDTEGTIDFLPYDMTIVINTDIDYWYWVCKL